MRIGFATASVSRDGGGLFDGVLCLAQAMNRYKEIRLFGLADKHTAADLPRWAPLKVNTFQIGGPAQFGFAPGMVEAMVRADLSLAMVHGMWMYPSVAVSAWHRATGRPYIVHPHGMLDPWALKNSFCKKRLAGILFQRRHMKKASCIRALCRPEADAIRAYGLKNPIAIIPNGIELPADSDFTPHGILGPVKQSGKKVLLFLSRIHTKKGLVNLIKAWSAIQTPKSSTLSSKPSDWVLAIAGWDQGGHEAELKRLASHLGIKWSDIRSQSPIYSSSAAPSSDSLYFLGPHFNEAKAQCYCACEAVILPSFSEGLPMVVLEAWAHAKPVLMTPECNLPEGFTSGAAIRILPEPESIASGIEQLFALPDAERAKMGQNGYSLAKDRFSWAKIGAEMIQVYHWVLGRGEKPACVQT